MRDHGCVRILFPDFANASRGKLSVNITSSLPQIHLPAGPLHHPSAEVLVRHEKDISIFWRRSDNLVGIAARANDVRECFHASAAVDVSDDVIVLLRMLL